MEHGSSWVSIMKEEGDAESVTGVLQPSPQQTSRVKEEGATGMQPKSEQTSVPATVSVEEADTKPAVVANNSSTWRRPSSHSGSPDLPIPSTNQSSAATGEAGGVRDVVKITERGGGERQVEEEVEEEEEEEEGGGEVGGGGGSWAGGAFRHRSSW